MNVKERFHQLIDDISDESTLENFYQLFQRLSNVRSGDLWAELTEDQKEELMAAYKESFDPQNLVSHEEAKRQHQKWLDQ